MLVPYLSYKRSKVSLIHQNFVEALRTVVRGSVHTHARKRSATAACSPRNVTRNKGLVQMLHYLAVNTSLQQNAATPHQCPIARSSFFQNTLQQTQPSTTIAIVNSYRPTSVSLEHHIKIMWARVISAESDQHKVTRGGIFHVITL